MRLDKAQRIELAVSTDDGREFIASAYLDTERRELAATNGHVLVVLPVTLDDGDTTGRVSVEALKAARKLATRGAPVEVQANGALQLTNGASYPRPDTCGEFPNYREVMPDYSARKTVTFGVNASYLWQVAQAIGCTKGDANVMITIPVPSDDGDMLDPIKVERTGDDSVGVVMPCRL